MTAPDVPAPVVGDPTGRPRRRLLALLPAGSLVLSLLLAGGVHGFGRLARDCARTTVEIWPVVLQNGLLNALLMTGLFTAGLSTLVFGGALLVTTGATIGGVLGAYGHQGAALLAPHGLLELGSWVLATSIGLHPLTRRLAGSDLPPAALARRAGSVFLLVLLAAPLERVWTSYYGNAIYC
jgi:hypothetical protein